MIRAEVSLTIGRRCTRGGCTPQRRCDRCRQATSTGKGKRGKGPRWEWVDDPRRGGERWQVYRDDHDGQDPKWVGEHHGPATTFRPPTPPRPAPAAPAASFPPASPFTDGARDFASGMDDAVTDTSSDYDHDPSDFLP